MLFWFNGTLPEEKSRTVIFYEFGVTDVQKEEAERSSAKATSASTEPLSASEVILGDVLSRVKNKNVVNVEKVDTASADGRISLPAAQAQGMFKDGVMQSGNAVITEPGVTHFSTSGDGGQFVNENGDPIDLRNCYARTKSGDRLGRDVYIRTPMDNLNWFEFPKDEHVQGVLKNKGVKDLPIRLRVGKHASAHQGYGWMHILNHMGDMQEVGESPLLFLYNTLTNFVSMNAQSRGRYALRGQKSYYDNRLLVVDLIEEDGCYSMVTCYPLFSQRQVRGSELLIGRALFRFTHSNDRTRISHDTQPDKVATGAESTSGKAQAAGNIASEPSAVNIYDIEVVDSKGSRVYSQPYEPTVNFSVIGERAETWEKYKDRAFKGRGDGRISLPDAQAQGMFKDGVMQSGIAVITEPGANFSIDDAQHVSPHLFREFDLEHVGSGEGAQAYGWGCISVGNGGVYNRTCSGMMPLYNTTVYTIAYTAVYTTVYTVVYTKGGHNK